VVSRLLNFRYLSLRPCVRVTGNTTAMGRALDVILEKIFSDPVSNSCPNVSYSDAQLAASLAGGSVAGVGSKLHTGMIPNHPSFAMLRYSLRYCGYAESSIEEIVASIYTLASYGFLSLAEGSTDPNDPTGIATMLGIAAASGIYPYPASTSSDSDTTANYATTVAASQSSGANYAMTAPGFADSSANAGMPYGTYPGFMNAAAGSYDQNAAAVYHQYYGYNSSDYSGSASIPPPPPPPAPPTTEAANSAQTVTHSFEIGEHMVGVLLGPAGRSITDLQTWSGATVEVSKKGVFAPGTRNRIVTITGSALAVHSASYFMKQCIDYEEMRRAASYTQPSPPQSQPRALPPSNAYSQPYSQPWPAPQQTAR